MIIGHFAVAFLLIFLFPQVPIWVPLLGVSFPDVLWGILLLVRREEVAADSSGQSPNGLVFRKYPYSHSLVLTTGFSLLVGGALGVGLGNLLVVPIFAAASASHWFIDAFVHVPDLPVLGFNSDRKVGLGLWRWGRTTWFIELAMYLGSAVIFLPFQSLPWVLTLGIVVQALNAPSIFRKGRKNQMSSAKALALGALLIFGGMSALLVYLI